jgi:hypothetical protein
MLAPYDKRAPRSAIASILLVQYHHDVLARYGRVSERREQATSQVQNPNLAICNLAEGGYNGLVVELQREIQESVRTVSGAVKGPPLSDKRPSGMCGRRLRLSAVGEWDTDTCPTKFFGFSGPLLTGPFREVSGVGREGRSLPEVVAAGLRITQRS